MLCAGVVLPHPPMLVSEIAAGAAAELDGLRAACLAALADGFSMNPKRVVLVGEGEAAGQPEQGLRPTFRPFGMPGPPRGLPLSLSVGSWLVERAGWFGELQLQAVAASTDAAGCAALGVELAAMPGRSLLVAMGDGSARRSTAAPGYLDPRAAAFDAAAAACLASADSQGLLDLDPALAAELWAVGRAAWQVLAGAATTPMNARLHYDEAPYGVGYLVASWRPVSLTASGTPGACYGARAGYPSGDGVRAPAHRRHRSC